MTRRVRVKEGSATLDAVRLGIKQFCDTVNPMTVKELAFRIKPNAPNANWIYDYLYFLEARGEIIIHRPGQDEVGVMKITLPKIQPRLPHSVKSKKLSELVEDVAKRKMAENKWTHPETPNSFYKEMKLIIKIIGDQDVTRLSADDAALLKMELELVYQSKEGTIRARIGRLRELAVEAVRQGIIEFNPIPKPAQLLGPEKPTSAPPEKPPENPKPRRPKPKPEPWKPAPSGYEVGYIRRFIRAIKRGLKKFWKTVY